MSLDFLDSLCGDFSFLLDLSKSSFLDLSDFLLFSDFISAMGTGITFNLLLFYSDLSPALDDLAIESLFYSSGSLLLFTSDFLSDPCPGVFAGPAPTKLTSFDFFGELARILYSRLSLALSCLLLSTSLIKC